MWKDSKETEFTTQSNWLRGAKQPQTETTIYKIEKGKKHVKYWVLFWKC